MTKQIDFGEASERHLTDAKLLETQKRVANAGHLFGLSAECGIKVLLIALGHPTKQNGDLVHTHGFREHVNKLASAQAQLKTFVNGRSGAKYLAMLPSIGNFADWDVGHRYFAQDKIPNLLAQWHAAAQEVGLMIQSAKLDGVVP